MMPRLPSTVIRKAGIAVALFVLLVLAVALPARHVLLPAWPERVEEWLIEAEPGRVDRQFVPAGQRTGGADRLLTRSRPTTLWRIERNEDGIEHFWLAGVRNAEGELLPGLPPWLEAVRLDGPLPDAVELVFIDAGRQTVAVNGAVIRRMYRPNELSFSQRAGLWRDRLSERWVWPFSATPDARMSPLHRSTASPEQP